MSHDRFGIEVKLGDVVEMEFVVTSVQACDEYCNLTLLSTEKMYPGEHKTTLTANTKQVQKVG